MKNLILSFSILLMSVWTATASAKPKYGNFQKLVPVSGVGELKVEYKYLGEPISRPRSFQIYLKCGRAKDWTPVGEYQMCELDNYEIDVKKRTLTVDYIDAIVEPTTGVATCNQRGHGEVDLTKICK